MIDFSALSLSETTRLFSKERISNYESVAQHFGNLALIGEISENLEIAEILLRNKIDYIMSQSVQFGGALWLDNLANHFKNGVRLRWYHKAKLLVYLLRNLRNMAFHFENLYKLNADKKPRLLASIQNNENALAVIK